MLLEGFGFWAKPVVSRVAICLQVEDLVTTNQYTNVPEHGMGGYIIVVKGSSALGLYCNEYYLMYMFRMVHQYPRVGFYNPCTHCPVVTNLLVSA